MNYEQALRYWYSFGYKNRDAAQDALEYMFAAGEVSESERPIVRSYIARNGRRRFGISLEDRS